MTSSLPAAMSAPATHLSRPIFVVGAPRSGTHLVRYCLNRHSRIHIAFESGFFLHTDGNRLFCPPSAIAGRASEVLETLFASGDPSVVEYQDDRADIKERITRGVSSYGELAEVIFGTIAKRRGKLRWGEKTPLHAVCLSRIFELFPEARVIHIRRDAKNTVASFLASPLLPDNIVRACSYFVCCNHIPRRFADRVLSITYENLTANPERVLSEMCAYIGEEYEAEMLKPGRRDSSYDRGLVRVQPDIGIVKPDSTRWMTVLSPRDAAFVDYVAGTGPFQLALFPTLTRLWLEKVRLNAFILRARIGVLGILPGRETRRKR